MLIEVRQWRNEITLHFQHGYGEKIPVMMLGLKRDLRVEGQGVIYPQEVTLSLFILILSGYACGADIDRHIALRRNCDVIDMRSVRLLRGSCLRRRLRIFQEWGLWRRRGKAGRVLGGVLSCKISLFVGYCCLLRAGVCGMIPVSVIIFDHEYRHSCMDAASYGQCV